MRKTQYTPGKWSIAYDIPGSIIDAEGDTVARVVQYTSNPYEVKAHAHLIAAAPELLEALETFQRAWDENRLLTSDEAYSMRAAIAKARGLQ